MDNDADEKLREIEKYGDQVTRMTKKQDDIELASARKATQRLDAAFKALSKEIAVLGDLMIALFKTIQEGGDTDNMEKST